MADKGNFGRRTWDREKYEKLHKERIEREKKSREVQEVEGAVTLNRDALNFSANLNKRQVVTSEITRTKGKAFGFYCEVCDLTFKDNLKFVDHLNSKPHLIRSGELEKMKGVVTLEEVKERFEMLVKKLEEKRDEKEKYDIKQRIEKRRQFEEERKEKKKLKKETKQKSSADPQDEMSIMMGFSGFGSTKK